ncbi:amidohydrolase family protein [Phototrophicus methaneseepsis]|uniref:Amidohydrolase family protein n=1 Tax=Phototrophicus methaneseepsis TaxID=2710758 RepID=A0A7S8E5G8_9CHLR|nr:amidohydrolase [Phototrophicus methaneseepsis]QPC80747.1 amidohydrolase family protein [Phototrophicus methaneseepsis]
MIDRILFNGHIHTLNASLPHATAIAISYGRIVAIGTDDDVLPLATAGTIRQNLNGKTVLPGMVDAHVHWEWTSKAMHSVDVETSTKEEALRRIADYAAGVPDGEWITGWGWAQDLWPDRAFPTAADLDAIVPDKPVFLRAKSGHAAWANTLALQLAHVTGETPVPAGSDVMLDTSGEPTGILLEAGAIDLVDQHVPPISAERLAYMMQVAQERAHKGGLTGLHDFDDPSCLYALQILRERGQLGLRVLKQINKDFLPAAIESGIRSGFGDEWLRIGNLKMFADGALGPRTAYMVEPYENEPENYGIVILDKEQMYEAASAASAAGLATTIHAIGDRAVHDVLDVFESVREEEKQRGELTSQRRHRIEHVQIIHPDDRHRLAELDIIASMQPNHATSDWSVADRWWGARSQWAYNARLQIDQGVKVAFGSDSPIEAIEPIPNLYAAITRQDRHGMPEGGWYPESRLSIDEAIRGFTLGPAYAARLEDRLGQLAVGYLADLVVLDRDPYAIDPSELLAMQVLATMVDGEWRYTTID